MWKNLRWGNIQPRSSLLHSPQGKRASSLTSEFGGRKSSAQPLRPQELARHPSPTKGASWLLQAIGSTWTGFHRWGLSLFTSASDWVCVHLEDVAFGRPFGCLHRSRQRPTFHQQWSQPPYSASVTVHLSLSWFRPGWGRENPIYQSPQAPTVSERNTEFTGPCIQKVKFYQ